MDCLDCLNVTSRSRAAPGNPGIGLENIGLVYKVQQSLTINVGRALDSTQFIAVSQWVTPHAFTARAWFPGGSQV